MKGVLFTAQEALPLLRHGGSVARWLGGSVARWLGGSVARWLGGSVILTSSTTSIKGTGAFSVYSATKTGARNFARSWILDLKDRRIRVNASSPGRTETAGLNDLFGGGDEAQDVKV